MQAWKQLTQVSAEELQRSVEDVLLGFSLAFKPWLTNIHSEHGQQHHHHHGNNIKNCSSSKYHQDKELLHGRSVVDGVVKKIPAGSTHTDGASQTQDAGLDGQLSNKTV